MTISVGGNDAGFADVLTECAPPWWAGDCNGAIDDAQAFITNTLPGRLLHAVRRDPGQGAERQGRRGGLPADLHGRGLQRRHLVLPAEQTRLNQTADLLNSRTVAAAAARGFAFANPTSRFVGHAVCDGVEWINGLSYPISESYHPNKPGHSSGLHARP